MSKTVYKRKLTKKTSQVNIVAKDIEPPLVEDSKAESQEVLASEPEPEPEEKKVQPSSNTRVTRSQVMESSDEEEEKVETDVLSKKADKKSMRGPSGM